VPTLLVIDDERSVCYSFRRVFEAEGVRVLTAETAAAGLQLLRENKPDVVVLDLQLPDRSGLDLFRELHAESPKRPVIFITAHGTTDTAIEAMKSGAFDYLLKPLELEKLTRVLGRAFGAARLMAVPAVLPGEEAADHIVGHSAVMQEMCKAIGRLAPQEVPVLILGESGTGKELVARALYHHSRRSDRPFLAVNCAALPETLQESELFGHERGAFTGADRRRVGKFEQCDGGTLFLDEVGDMAPALQAKMLRVLQDQRFERVGGTETLQTDVRLLAATNQDLPRLVAEGRFRNDLLYRLNAVSIRVPPLRERADDVAELAHFFLYRFNRQMNRDLRGFSPEALERLQAYEWPGNVRQLEGIVLHAMLNASGHLILPEFLPDEFQERPRASLAPVSAPESLDVAAFIEDRLTGPGGLYAELIAAVERVLLTRVLRHTRGNQTQACEILGLSRPTLRHKLRTLGLAVERSINEGHSGEKGKGEEETPPD
jgi:two-component system, NtrC family, nitrogen regulation response regulator GlnG